MSEPRATLALIGRITARSAARGPALHLGLRGRITTRSAAALQRPQAIALRAQLLTRSAARAGAAHLGLHARLTARAQARTSVRVPLFLAGRLTTRANARLASVLRLRLTARASARSALAGLTQEVEKAPPPPLPPELRPPPILLADYLNRITGFHNQRPRYMATVGMSIAPAVDAQAAALSLIGLFDLDTATGQALDFVGEWIGVNRIVQFPIDPWFSFDLPNLGFDLGKWQEPYEEQTGLVILSDENYRLLLYARVAANYWDGSLPGAYAAWDILFQQTGFAVLLQDNLARLSSPSGAACNGDMSLIQAILGPPLDQVTNQLFAGGYLGLKSAGVRVNYMTQDQTPVTGGIGKPLFGFDVGPAEGPASFPPTTLAGFDMGGWGQMVGSSTPVDDGAFPPGTQAPLPDAPTDGTLYGRQREAWLPTVPLAGGTMQGPLQLPGAPSDPNEAATKQYADDKDAGEF